MIADGFQMNYQGNVVTMFCRDLFIGLWSLLLVIPGIVKSYEYRMVPYILAENPSIHRKDAFKLSQEMMDGEKWNAFVLDLSFILWRLAAAFTCGILNIFYVNPYIDLTFTELYILLKETKLGLKSDTQDNSETDYFNNQFTHF